ncbi:class C sortase [Corynebacterium sp. HS2168-gen11]|uniref:class C sortase n=1 Tax=Corynebacterium sp. HS2168-gen11 TaxID=2974027 RepID=UPI00216AC7A5|nr:class C sortase [Corynebacterium sp. HS2168-gen11]MCS4536427.1 class C sortase [Corynebacterium sp. HS2168-gen11]
MTMVADSSVKKSNSSSVLTVMLSLIGIVLMLYPVVSTVYENNHQSSVVKSYTTKVEEFSAEELDGEIRDAQHWNEQYEGGPILDPWLSRISEDNEEYQKYLGQLDLTDVMARISIPAIDSDLPIYHGSSESVLSKGIGHLFGSDLPVGGVGSHVVLTGHTGLSVATLWDNLVKVKVGDDIYLSVSGQQMKYKVRELQTVLPGESDSLLPVPDKDLISLITCTPYGINSHRLLVHAERVALDQAEGTQVLSTVKQPWQWWMTAVLIIVGLFLLIMLNGLRKNYLHQRARKRAGDDE